MDDTKQKTEETQQTEPSMEDAGGHTERGATEKIWDATVKGWNTATFRANQYRRVVQKKIDITSVHKKISAAHADLGTAVDNLRQGGEQNILGHPDVCEIFQKLDSLRTAAATLEEEIVAIKGELPPEETPD